MNWDNLFGSEGAVIHTRGDLLRSGVTARQLTTAVRARQLIRVRQGLYALPGTPDAVMQAVRIGGRLACVSVLAAAGVWVADARFVHLHLRREASRSRSPRNRFAALTRDNRDGCELHWRPLTDPGSALEHAVGRIDAMIQAVRCQHPWFALASLDSALRTGYLTDNQIEEVFLHAPRRLHYLRALVDARSGSGLETVLRIMLREAGIECEIQLYIDGVGAVDFVVAGCVVIETDGAEFHGDRTKARDYDRDLTLAVLGFTVIRLNYRQVMFERERVVRAIRTAIASHRRSGTPSRGRSQFRQTFRIPAR